MDRATPYHRPHSTQVAGYAVIYGADDRWIGNLFRAATPTGLRGGRAGPPRSRTRHGRLRRPSEQPRGVPGLHRLPAPGDHNRFPTSTSRCGSARQRVRRRRPRLLRQSPNAVQSGCRRDGRGTDGDEVHLEVELPDAFDAAARPASSPARTWSGSASPTRTSRSATAPWPSWTSTCSAVPNRTISCSPPDRCPTSNPAPIAYASGNRTAAACIDATAGTGIVATEAEAGVMLRDEP